MRDIELYPLMQVIHEARRRVEYEDLADQGSFRDVMDALHEMERRGWVDIRRPLHGDNRLMSAHGIQLSGAGVAALDAALREGQDIGMPTADETAIVFDLGSLEEKRTARGVLMDRVYRATDGNRLQRVDVNALGNELEWAGNVTSDIVRYLVDEGLLERAGWGGLVALTHAGVREVEQLLHKPEEPTRHFAPITTVIVHGDVLGQIQAGTHGSTQSQGAEIDKVASFLSELKAALPQADMDPAQRDLMLVNVDLVETALKDGGPEASIVRRLLPTLRELAVGIASNGAFLGLAQAIQGLS